MRSFCENERISRRYLRKTVFYQADTVNVLKNIWFYLGIQWNIFHPHVVTLQRLSNSSCLEITDRSFYHQAPALWNSLPKHLHTCSSMSPQYSNQLFSPFPVFLSIPQTTENLPFPSILSSLDYLLPGLTLWNSTRPDTYLSFISTSFIAYFILYIISTVYWNKLTKIHFCQLYGAL